MVRVDGCVFAREKNGDSRLAAVTTAYDVFDGSVKRRTRGRFVWKTGPSDQFSCQRPKERKGFFRRVSVIRPTHSCFAFRTFNWYSEGHMKFFTAQWKSLAQIAAGSLRIGNTSWKKDETGSLFSFLRFPHTVRVTAVPCGTSVIYSKDVIVTNILLQRAVTATRLNYYGDISFDNRCRHNITMRRTV